MGVLKDKYSKFLEVLGNPDRIKMLELLTDGEKNVQEINKNFFASQATVSYHLSLLKEIGFVKSRKSGKFMYYSQVAENIKNYLKNFVRDFSYSLSK